MLGAQSTKAKHQVNLSPPKLQRIPKSDSTDVQTRNTTKSSKASSATSHSSSNSEKKESSWFAQTENEFLQSHDGTLPKPAQNIALMGGKRYIVVPKNNAMAVQPAITVKPDKIGDKPPILQDGSLNDISNTVDSTIPTKSRVPLTTTSLGNDVDKLIDKDTLKDISHTELKPCSTIGQSDETCNRSDNTDTVAANNSENQLDLSNTRDLPLENKKPLSSKSPEWKAVVNNSNTTSTTIELPNIDTQQSVTSSLGTIKLSSK